MKNPIRTTLILVVFIANLAVFAASGSEPKKSGKVEIKNDHILIHPGTKLSAKDAKALNDILQKYDKSLYKIEVYEKGK